MATKVFPAKDPDELADYDFDWTTTLCLFGETVPSDTIDLTKPTLWKIDGGTDTSLVKDTSINPQGQEDGATLTKIWLSGGTLGVKYTITNRIVTVAGRRLERSGVLSMTQKGWQGAIP